MVMGRHLQLETQPLVLIGEEVNRKCLVIYDHKIATITH